MNPEMAAAQNTARKYWYVFALIFILIIGYQVRAVPARFNEIQGLDELHFYAMSEYVLNNNLRLPERDYMRHHPFGVNPLEVESLGPIYAPVLLYLLMFQFTGLSYYSFALIYPAIMGAIASILMFFIGREIHNNYTGVFASFFLATVPAFITRTSAGEIEKEAVFAVTGLLAMLFFIMAYRRNSWKHSLVYSSLSGIFLTVSMLASAQVRFLMIIMAIFSVILLIANRPQKLAPSFIPAIAIAIIGNSLMPNRAVNDSIIYATAAVMGFVLLRHAAEKWAIIKKENLIFFSPAIIFLAFIAIVILSAFLQPAQEIVRSSWELISLQQPSAIGYTVAENQPGSISSMVQQAGLPFIGATIPPLGQLSGLSIWFFSFFGILFCAYKIFRTRDVIWLLPAVWLFASMQAVLFQIRLLFLLGPIVSLTAGLFAGAFAGYIISGNGKPYKMVSLGLAGISALGAVWGLSMLNPFIASAFALASAAFFLAYLPEGSRYMKIENRETPEVLYYAAAGLLLLLSIYSFQAPGFSLYTLAVWQVQVQFTILTISLLSLGALLFFTQIYANAKSLKLQPRFILIALFTAMIVALNYGNALAYGYSIGPTICFTGNPALLIDGQRCLETDSKSNVIRYAQGQPWYEGMTFLREKTPENSSVISWWDFGYWFQVRGKRPSISDGGQGPRKEIADWFIADASNWTGFEPWLKGKYKVDYILMDYTLPGKYGAITAIATDGKGTQVAIQLDEKSREEQNGVTVIEECCIPGQNPVSILLFVQGSGLVAPPAVALINGGRVANVGTVDEVCTAQGIINFQNATGDIGGCIALTNFGIFYLPEPMQKTIFSRLMFMDGFGLPVEKQFDNQLIKIYKLL